MSFEQAGTLIEAAHAEMGLGEEAFDSASFGTSNPTLAQMVRLADAVGRGLIRKYLPLRQRKDYTFTTTDNFTLYDLPFGFLSMVDSTGWNRTSGAPLCPVSPQRWQALQAFDVASTSPMLFRIVIPDDDDISPALKQIEFATNPGEATIAFAYQSKYWVHPADDTSTRYDALAETTDYVLIEPFLFSRALKLAYKREKGFDTTTAQEDFDQALRMALGHDEGAASALSLNGPSGGALLSASNVPDNGFGE